MSTGLELRTRHQSNLLSTCSLVSVRPRVATALEDIIRSKTAAGRAKDLATLPQLRAALDRRRGQHPGPGES